MSKPLFTPEQIRLAARGLEIQAERMRAVTRAAQRAAKALDALRAQFERSYRV